MSLAESVSFKVDKSGNGGSGSSGHGGSGNRDLGPEYRMPPRLEMLLDMPPVGLEEQIKHAWNTEDRWVHLNINLIMPIFLHGVSISNVLFQILQHLRQG